MLELACWQKIYIPIIYISPLFTLFNLTKIPYTPYNVYEEVYNMRTNIVLDDKLVKEAFKISNAKTKKELVHLALEEYVRQHKTIKNLLDLKGKIVFEKDYNYKALRQGEQE